MSQEQFDKIKNGNGFIAALDQSGGSTPKALKQYGVDESSYSNEEEMFDCIHDMRSRIIKSPVFDDKRILGAILFEKTMDNNIDGTPTAEYLWNELQVVPFLKVDKGLEDTQDGVQLMKPMPDLDALLARVKGLGVFGTKMRSVIHDANETGIRDIVGQQFEVGKQIIAGGLVPIIEPEVNINSAQKSACENILKAEILTQLNTLNADQIVMLKLTLPEQDNLYAELIAHPNVLSVVALSGGYDLEEACTRLSRQNGMIASFSRALTNDLRHQLSNDAFNTALNQSIERIYQASISGESASDAA